ncbi:MAG: DUF5107 domain-containing protein [Lachnospiraceae bacterium]|nr:DUF5107 domain-containing protein [Lachnospiraceae bacterium]
MKIRTEIFTIKGAPLEGTNPLPAFRNRKPDVPVTSDRFPEHLKTTLGTNTKVLPYLTQDRYSRKRLPLKLKSFVLENEHLTARFLPEYGGRLYSLFDKDKNEELLFSNPVIQPGNLAIRNAWLSGGIEWNIGNLGHCYTTCDNVFSAILQDDDGNDFLRIYEFERLKSIFWQVDFHLPEDTPYLITHVRMINPFDQDTTTYWWSNVAVPDDGSTRILASGKKIMSFTEGKCDYELLPYIDSMPGKDLSYPSNAPRSFDYFIQENFENESTWEAAAYPNGTVFYERSTAPLSYKKLFGWGNHHAGRHWQEFLSDGAGTGYYAEIQAGIAPSQLHDKILPAHSTYEWTQCFGGIKLDRDALFAPDFHQACSYFDDSLNSFLSTEDILALNDKLCKLADLPVAPTALCHNGSGFGALEIMRMEQTGKACAPASMYFPVSSVGKTEYPWYNLLKTGILPAEDVRVIPDSYMISEKWFPLLSSSLKKENGRTWYSLLHYGVAVYEHSDLTRLANSSYNEEADTQQTEAARKAWTESVTLTPNVWAYRNLAFLEKQCGNTALAEHYYDCALKLPGVYDDFALVSEYLIFLCSQARWEKVWQIFSALPLNCRNVDRIRISAAQAAVKLDHLDYLELFFAQEHHDIREGEVSLTDIWFEFCARRMAKERGISLSDTFAMQALLDEAWDTCPPAAEIDFRMSFDKNLKYRI